MSAERFTIEPHTTFDKKFTIYGPEDLTLFVDFDDVDHDSVDLLAVRMVELLNKHWK